MADLSAHAYRLHVSCISAQLSPQTRLRIFVREHHLLAIDVRKPNQINIHFFWEFPLSLKQIEHHERFFFGTKKNIFFYKFKICFFFSLIQMDAAGSGLGWRFRGEQLILAKVKEN